MSVKLIMLHPLPVVKNVKIHVKQLKANELLVYDGLFVWPVNEKEG